MATDSILGLFTDPYQYMQQQNQAQDAAAQRFAQMDPMQRAQYGIYKGAGQLGGGFAGAMGAQDPALVRQSKRQQLLQGLDFNDPASLANASRAALEAGDVQASRELAMAAEKARAAQLDTAVKTSQIARNMREPRAAALPELAKLQEYRAQLIEQYGESDPRVKEIDDAIKKKTTGKSMGQEIGEGLGAGLGLIGKALGAGLKKEGEETGQFAAKDFNALGSAVAAGTASKRNLATLETALQNSFTGKFADSKESIITSLTALGVPVGDDLKQAATNKQLIDAMGTRYVFPLVKNFPGSLAAKELERLEKTAPNSLQQPETIQRLVNLMKVDLAENEYTYNQAKQYKASKNSLIGFNQADSKIEFQQKLNKLQGMVGAARRKGSVSKEEKDAIEALKQELGV